MGFSAIIAILGLTRFWLLSYFITIVKSNIQNLTNKEFHTINLFDLFVHCHYFNVNLCKLEVF